jgi:succinyl-diaminopimelate desuccinylase
MILDVLDLARDLIRRPSVTPADAGAMDTLQRALEGLGFHCRRMKFGEIENLYARRGTGGPNLCFAGHTDVVPAGDAAAWTHDPFAAEVAGGDSGEVLVGRGAVDMKGAIAAFVAAASRIAPEDQKGSISLLITGDEEGPAKDGTGKVVQALLAEGERVDHCILGEPTCAQTFGDQVKIGRRGSLNAQIEVEGKQGHVAYPHKALNPIPLLVRLLAKLQDQVLDEGYPGFPASNLEITTIDVGNPTHNLIPARAMARVNIRFNPHHTMKSLANWMMMECGAMVQEQEFTGQVSLEPIPTGDAFYTEPGPFVEVVAGAVEDVTGQAPALTTTGGISDARFIRSLCPVVEFGLVGATMHAVDEQVPVKELRDLEAVYGRLIERYFAAFA